MDASFNVRFASQQRTEPRCDITLQVAELISGHIEHGDGMWIMHIAGFLYEPYLVPHTKPTNMAFPIAYEVSYNAKRVARI